MLIFGACNKSSDLGLNIQPEEDLLLLNYSDTASVISFTIREDSLKTDKLNRNMLGAFNDPLFGLTRASIYTQLVLSNTSPDFGTNPVVDSIALSLAYDPDYYGQLAQQQTLNVFELTEDMYYDSAYYSNRQFTANTTDLVSAYAFTPAPTDSVTVDGIKLAPQLRVLLPNSLGQSFLNNQSLMTTDKDFRTFFKGLHITTSDNPGVDQGALLTFSLIDPLSKVTLYYHNDSEDSLKFDFPIGSGAARVSNFYHDYSSVSDINNQLSDSTLGQNLTYVQALAGVKTKVWFPHVKSIVDSGRVAVNKAEVILQVEPGTESSYSPPANLVILGIDSLGKSYALNDALEGIMHYGGEYDATNKLYKFNIARHMQFLLDGKINDYGFYIATTGAAVQANRVVLRGGANGSTPIKLKLTYTKLN